MAKISSFNQSGQSTFCVLNISPDGRLYETLKTAMPDSAEYDPSGKDTKQQHINNRQYYTSTDWGQLVNIKQVDSHISGLPVIQITLKSIEKENHYDIVFISLVSQNKSLTSYARSFIMICEQLKFRDVIRIFPWKLMDKDKKINNAGNLKYYTGLTVYKYDETDIKKHDQRGIKIVSTIDFKQIPPPKIEVDAMTKTKSYDYSPAKRFFSPIYTKFVARIAEDRELYTASFNKDEGEVVIDNKHEDVINTEEYINDNHSFSDNSSEPNFEFEDETEDDLPF